MSNSGTNETERGLNVPKSDEELAEQILSAVSEGNTEEMGRLFSVSIPPDAASDEEEDSNKDSEAEQEDDEPNKEPDSPPAVADEASRVTTQEQSPAEERLAKLERELADAKAVAGRTSALQSRLAQLENQLKKAKAAEQPKVSAEDQELDDRIARLKEVDPDTASILESLRKQQPKAKPQEDTADDAVREEYYKVLEVHNDADKIFNHPYWHMWKGQLTREQRDWAESADSQKVIVAVDEFKKFLSGFGQPAQTQQVAVVEEDVVDAAKIARDKKLHRSADSADTPVKKGSKFDETSFFAEAYEKLAKEAGITY